MKKAAWMAMGLVVAAMSPRYALAEVKATGCTTLFEVVAAGLLAEIATGSSEDPAMAARGYVRWRSWSLMSGRIDPSWVRPWDIAAGPSMSGLEGLPEGSGACVALAYWKMKSGEWPVMDLGAAVQQAVNDLAATNWVLSNQEVARLTREAQSRSGAKD